MSTLYPQAIRRLRWLLDAVETQLDRQPEDALISRDVLRRMSTQRIATDDEIALAIAALAELCILHREANHWRVDVAKLHASSGYRRGVREALQLVDGAAEATQVDLLIALPPSVDPSMRHGLLREGNDLRSALIDLIASSQHRIVLASPFWDTATTLDLKPLLKRRIAAGVQVDLLGRSLDHYTRQGMVLRQFAEELGAERCRAFAWQRPSVIDPFGSETFHLKVAIADDGARAYMGTANFTAASLRSRLELGLMVRGPIARSLACMLDMILDRATSYQ